MLGTGTFATTAAFAEGGSGGVPGTGHGSSGAWDLYSMSYDDLRIDHTPIQGMMGASTEWFINNYPGPNGNGPGGDGAKDAIREACTLALGQAETRGGNMGQSRVVSIFWAGSSTNAWENSSSAAAHYFQERWDNFVSIGMPGIFTGTDAKTLMKGLWGSGLSQGGATPSAVCIALNQNEPPQLIPEPDKAWTFNEAGALVIADPTGTNTVGADGQLFFPGDTVSAVVNGHIKGGMGANLSKYVIRDDWTKAANYVDFTDPAQSKVFYETAPGSGSYTNVTSQFTINVAGTITTATAKAAFLSSTAGQSGDRSVKLIISGRFRSDYDTAGATVQLWNNGSETWNDNTEDTNEPPVFTWTPEPDKTVLGSAEEAGGYAHADIDGLSVFPGQKLEYSISVDLRIPDNAAHGINKLGVEDTYDANFVPDKSSVEFWDSRDPRGATPIPRASYDLDWDDAAHKWTATFADEWLAANVGPDSQWLSAGWLTARFTGTVSAETAPGSVVKNQAFEIINDSRTATSIPEVTIPLVSPDKEDLSTDLVNIDGKTVVKGNTILYRLTLDAGVPQDDLAYYVHKLGMVDDYDEEYLDVVATDIGVAIKATGEDVTAKFNIQIIDGVVYVFAKQVDSTGPHGDTILGDPQPEDLAAYSAADIDPATTPLIDQELLGQQFWITIPATVTRELDGYVIENQAVQNLENMTQHTRIVSNPLTDINPSKDVVASIGGESIDGTEVELHSIFTYELTTSTIPADRAYGASQWSITDAFDRVHDSYTGKWAVYAATDLYDEDTLVAPAGELIQDQGSVNASGTEYFTVVFDEDTYTFTIEATQEYFDLANSRPDLPQAWTVYTQMERISSATKVVNEFTETYNNVERASNQVVTHTPAPPPHDEDELSVTGGVQVAWLYVLGGIVLLTGATLWLIEARRRHPSKKGEPAQDRI